MLIKLNVRLVLKVTAVIQREQLQKENTHLSLSRTTEESKAQCFAFLRMSGICCKAQGVLTY